MKQYKINRDQNPKAIPSDEVIAKYKNFKQLQVSYKDVTKRSKIPLYKNRKMFLFLLLVALVVWIIAEDGFDEETPEKENTEIKK